MPPIRLHTAYDGTNFHGWQRQFQPPHHPDALAPGNPASLLPDHPIATPPEKKGHPELRTPQGVLARALADLYRTPVHPQGASRTDAGVHARAQTVMFHPPAGPDIITEGPPLNRLPQALNTRLPDDMLVLNAAEAPDTFDPISDCLEKAYTYTIATGHTRPLFDRHTTYHTHHALDPAAMQHAADRIIGEHDFAAFAHAHHNRESTVRTVTACTITTPADNRITITVAGTGFLYNMVRIIAGTLLDAGRHKLTPDDVSNALHSKDRTHAGPTLPPQGLTLLWQRYPFPIGTVGTPH